MLRTAQALEHRRCGDLLVQIGKTLDEKLPRLGMASVKLLDEHTLIASGPDQPSEFAIMGSMP